MKDIGKAGLTLLEALIMSMMLGTAASNKPLIISKCASAAAFW